jgi:hypothetical protein
MLFQYCFGLSTCRLSSLSSIEFINCLYFIFLHLL